MKRKTLKLVLEVLSIQLENSNGEQEYADAIAEIKALAQATPLPVQAPIDIAALVEGMEVSIDVSTGDHDSGHRLFGTVTRAQESQGSKHGLILLVQDPEPNFKLAPLPVQESVGYVYSEKGVKHGAIQTQRDLPNGTLLYATPLQSAQPVRYLQLPIDATPEMIEAAESVEDLYLRGTPDTWAKVYKAMVQAAPAQHE